MKINEERNEKEPKKNEGGRPADEKTQRKTK
jgi:hypothetical protein